MTAEKAAIFQDDIDLLNGLSDQDRARFEAWMTQLDAENAKLGDASIFETGVSLWQTTGAQCWFVYFDDGEEPADALREEMCCDSW